MTELATYNGWTNYPTWNVNLWLSNDQGSDEYTRELAQTAIEQNTEIEFTGEDDMTETVDRDGAISDCEDALKDWCEEMLPETQGFPADILGWAMSLVDWREIARHLIDDELED